MKITRLALVSILGALLVLGFACGGEGGISKPKVGYVPEGWSLEEGHTEEEGVDIPTYDWLRYKLDANGSIQINYCEVPRVIEKYRDDPEGLEVYLSGGSPRKGFAITVLSGQPAGVVSGYRSGFGDYYIYLICIKGNTFVTVNATWKDPEQLAEVMALINSISF